MWSSIGLTLQTGTWKGPLCLPCERGRYPPPPDPLTSECLPGRGVLSPSHSLTTHVMKPPPKCLWTPLDSILYTHLLRQSFLAQLRLLFLSSHGESRSKSLCQRREEGAEDGETRFSHPGVGQAWVQIQHFMSKGHLSFQPPTYPVVLTTDGCWPLGRSPCLTRI